MKRNLLIFSVVAITVTLMLIAGRHAAQKRAAGGQLAPGRNPTGTTAPDFELKSTDGKVVRLSEYHGKAVLLNFWATYCGPCKIEMPWFVDLQKQYGAQGLQIIGVSMDDDAEKNVAKIDEFARQLSVNYPVLLGNDRVGDAFGGINGLPTTFFVGRDGKIVAYVEGLVSHSEIEDNVKKALAEGSTVASSQAK